MRTYKDYITEASYEEEVRNNKANKIYPQYLSLYGEVMRFVESAYNRYEYSDIYYKLYDGKDITPDLRRYESIVKSLKDIIKNFEKTKYDGDIVETNNLLKKYDKAVEGYKKVQDMFKQIFSYLKVGESIDKSVKKVSEMTKKVKYFDMKGKNAYNGEFFDYYTVDDIMFQIKDFNGTVKLCGVSDLYVQYKNNKLVRYYF